MLAHLLQRRQHVAQVTLGVRAEQEADSSVQPASHPRNWEETLLGHHGYALGLPIAGYDCQKMHQGGASFVLNSRARACCVLRLFTCSLLLIHR